MRKLILLIMAVVVVAHLGFVAYMSADRQAAIAREEIRNSDREIRPIPYLKPNESEPPAGEIAGSSNPDADSLASLYEERPNLERVTSKKRVMDADPVRAVNRTNRSERRKSNRVRIPAFPDPRDLDEMGTMALNRETITIWYPGERPVAQVRDEPPPMKPSPPPRKEDRSFVDRIVMPIFKKPYGFIKSIGSKLR